MSTRVRPVGVKKHTQSHNRDISGMVISYEQINKSRFVRQLKRPEFKV